MIGDQREIRRKLRILEHGEAIGKVAKMCRYKSTPNILPPPTHSIEQKAYRWRSFTRPHLDNLAMIWWSIAAPCSPQVKLRRNCRRRRA